jgi:hypothetical protein
VVSKFEEIKQALEAGKTTREIAVELRVSLRDIARVRKLLNIDIGAMERAVQDLEKQITELCQEIDDKDSEKKRLIQEIGTLNRQIEEKRSYKQAMPVAIEAIHIPVNDSEVAGYLKGLDCERLSWLTEFALKVLQLKINELLIEQPDSELLRMNELRLQETEIELLSMNKLLLKRKVRQLRRLRGDG